MLFNTCFGGKFIFSPKISGPGREQFKDECGPLSLRDFVVHSRSRDVRRWNRILARACAVVTQCCEGAKLPVEDMGSPLQFQVGDWTKFFIPSGVKNHDIKQETISPPLTLEEILMVFFC